MARRQGRTLIATAQPGTARSDSTMLGLYVHVPFCQAICSYCNFNRGLYDAALKARYVPALEQEIRQAGDHRAADSVFFGGGTPSLLEPDEIGRVLAACRDSYDLTAEAEITLETNPETASVERLDGFRAAGVNRLSFGAQSFDNDQLARLGRVHNADRIDEAVRAARRAGMQNVSLDLMFWLPGQSRALWLESVDRAMVLDPDHLSLYLLELYPNAPLKEAMARSQAGGGPGAGVAWAQASDDEAADMYLEGLERLSSAGYEQYEISNVARPGRESRHNLKYWMSGAWRGFGCGAHSTVGQHRWQNVPGTADYIERIEQARPVAIQQRHIDAKARVEEALFTGLRLTAGIDRVAFGDAFGIDPWTEYGDRLTEAVEAGLVWTGSEHFGLTRPGMLLANEILSIFV